MDHTFEILKLEDYTSFLPLDIAAVHFSEPGAMGYHGVLRIITSDKRMFMVQYLYDEWPREDIIKVCPVIQEFTHALSSNCKTGLWKSFYMGFGNHLYAKAELAERFNFDGMAPPEIYGAWIGAVLDNL